MYDADHDAYVPDRLMRRNIQYEAQNLPSVYFLKEV